jgi:hypothetical protein
MSLPSKPIKWPSEDIGGMSGASLTHALNDVKERFTPEQRKDMVDSSQLAQAWANKVQAMLSNTSKVGAEKVDALIKRWFADEDTTEVTTMKKTLLDGFKKIAAAAGSGKLIFTDNPYLRGTDADGSFAYVWYDKLNVMYVGQTFFKNGLFGGLNHWALIVVHELSHLKCKTVDVPDRYDYSGIKPNKKSFPSSKAITNADNWAWFAADCNGALTAKARNDALKIAT